MSVETEGIKSIHPKDYIHSFYRPFNEGVTTMPEKYGEFSEVLYLTVADVEAHIGDPENIPSVEIKSAVQKCGDGRNEKETFGVFGGSAGEFLLHASVLEDKLGRPLNKSEVEYLFLSFLNKFGSIYLHTDTHAVHDVMHQLGVEVDILNPPKEYRARLLELLVQPNGVGCGHIRQMLSIPEYEVSPSLIRFFLEVFFDFLWNKKDTRVEYDVLEGNHDEGAVVAAKTVGEITDTTQVPLITPNVDGEQFFLIHPELYEYLRKEKYAPFFAEKYRELTGKTDFDAKAMYGAVAPKGLNQFNMTAEKLAFSKGLSVIEVEVDFNRGKRTLKVT